MFMKAPKGIGSVSFDGSEYAVGKNGVVEVPDAAAEILGDFGLVPTDAPAAANKNKESKPDPS